MSRQLLCAGVIGVLSLSMLGGCSNASLTQENVADSGTLSLPLTAESAGVKYRLNKAKFTITNLEGKLVRSIKPPADLPVDQEILPQGKYLIYLEDGWVLEAKGPGETSFVSVDAKLSTSNPENFAVERARTIDVVFGFVTPGGPIKLDQGRANVRISVQDCTSFDSIGATIATFTLDCLGRLDPQAFFTDDDGFLHRNFEECPANPEILQSIDDFLGLQYPRTFKGKNIIGNPLAISKECLAGRWTEWREQFDSLGIDDCPFWEKVGEINTPDPDDYERIGKELPDPPVRENGKPPSVLSLLKVNGIYAIKFAGDLPRGCKTPASCAAQCAAGFPGFVISEDGETVITDPPAWQKETVYSGTNPYLRAGYYHPMSSYGAIPGEIFSHINRAVHWDDPDPEKRETCTYYDNGFHVETPLLEDCEDMPDGTKSCIGVCAPSL